MFGLAILTSMSRHRGPAAWSLGFADRRMILAACAAMLLFPLAAVVLAPHPLEQPVGVDFTLYRDATARWLSGGSFYEPYQLAGPYSIRAGDVLYPPVALWLFVPFTLVPVTALATLLWAAIPVAIAGWAIWRLRPRPATWPIIAFCVVWPTTLLKLWTGNPVIWSVAALSLGVVHCWPSVFVLLKPSLFPFALFGADRRRWWLALAGFVALCLPFGAMWTDWLNSVTNSTGGGLLYSVLEVPMLFLPLVAWAGRTR